MTAKELGEQSASPVMGGSHKRIQGLTKRELFAYGAMKALLSNPECMHLDEEGTAKVAIKHANSLLEELAKEE